MKKSVFCVLGAAAAVSAWAGITTQVDLENGKYLVTVSDHSAANVLSAQQVAELGSFELVKLGPGTLRAGDELKDFAGKITVSDGYYEMSTTNALGTAAGETYSDGGTLVNKIGDYTTNGTKPTFKNETIHLKGTGCANNGALQNKAGNVDFCRKVILDGDTLINTVGNRFDFRSTTFDMNSYDLTLSCSNGQFYFVNLTLQDPGNIVVNGGQFEFQSTFNCNQGCRGKTVTLNGGATLSLWSCSSWVDYDIVFNKGSKLSTTNGAFNEYGSNNRNILYGTNMLNDKVALSIPKGLQIQLPGKVTGAGGLTGKTIGYLQFTTQTVFTNDFQGGVAVYGLVTNGCPLGGVIIYNDRAIPADGGALMITNAVLRKHTSSALALPDVVADGTAWITSSVSSTAISTAKTLTKTGDGTLDISMPLKVTGMTEVKGGTLRFSQQIPEHPRGLNWTWNNTSKGSGVDESGVSYAYKGWPNVVVQSYTYSGYIRVPGEEGTSVTCNWMTSIARGAKVTIDGVVCCNFNDNKNTKDGITVGWNRLAMYKPVTLKAGWKKIDVSMSNWYDTTRGPQANTSHGWEENFAIGVDWQARCVTNTANYAKLLDPGDGSFLRVSTNANVKLEYYDSDDFRPSFGGAVAFASGTTLDLNDYKPYSVLTIPSLIGLPTITNGSVKVTSSVWTLRGADLAVGVPLTVASNSEFQFGDENGVVTIAGDGEQWRKALRARKKSLSAGVTVVRNATAIRNTFVLDSSLAGEGWMLTGNGDDLQVSCNHGFHIIVK